MTTNYHHQGDNINVSGQGNIGAIKMHNQGQGVGKVFGGDAGGGDTPVMSG